MHSKHCRNFGTTRVSLALTLAVGLLVATAGCGGGGGGGGNSGGGGGGGKSSPYFPSPDSQLWPFGSWLDAWTARATTSGTAVVTLSSQSFEPVIEVNDPSGNEINVTQTGSANDFQATFPVTGGDSYVITVTTSEPNQLGPYALTVNSGLQNLSQIDARDDGTGTDFIAFGLIGLTSTTDPTTGQSACLYTATAQSNTAGFDVLAPPSSLDISPYVYVYPVNNDEIVPGSAIATSASANNSSTETELSSFSVKNGTTYCISVTYAPGTSLSQGWGAVLTNLSGFGVPTMVMSESTSDIRGLHGIRLGTALTNHAGTSARVFIKRPGNPVVVLTR
ncbi:MAG: hypothetical protein ACLQVD_14040 [Capsulimonadaceae bacterium]